MKTYLITGGAGFIGSNFVLYLLKKYNDIKIIMVDALTYAANLDNLKDCFNDSRFEFKQGNICDTNFIESVFKKNYIDYVVNFAAESHVDRSIASADLFVQTNVWGTVNLLNVAKKYWEKDLEKHKFIQISTDEVYGTLEENADAFTELTSISPRSPYSASKASADFFVMAFHETHNMPINITRCSNNYGRHQHEEKLIPTIIKNILSNSPVPVYGDGMQIRDWLYVEDHCSAIDVVINNGKNGEIYNVGGNNEIKNIEMINYIGNYLVNQSIVNKFDIQFVEDRKGHDRRYAINSTKIQQELGWKPNIIFKDGIVKTVNWYLKNLK